MRHTMWYTQSSTFPSKRTFGAHILQDLTMSYNITHIPKKGISHTKPWWGIGLISGFTSFTEIPNSNFSPCAGGFIEAAEECSSLSMRPWTMWNDRSEIGDVDLKNCRWQTEIYLFELKCLLNPIPVCGHLEPTAGFGLLDGIFLGVCAWLTVYSQADAFLASRKNSGRAIWHGLRGLRLHRKIPGKQCFFWKTTRLPDYLRIPKNGGPWFRVDPNPCAHQTCYMLHPHEIWDVSCTAVRQVWVRRWEMLLPRISEAHGSHGFQGTLVWHSGLCSLWWATKDAVPHRRVSGFASWSLIFFLHSLAECSLKILGDPWGNWNQAHHLPSSCWWELLEKGSSWVRGTWLWKWLPPKGQNNVLQRYSKVFQQN